MRAPQYEINLAIALSIEPKPEHDPLEIEYGKPTPEPVAWRWVQLADYQDRGWQPRDFTDPDACLMLMERMAANGGFSLAGSSMGFSCIALAGTLEHSSGCQPTIAEAVREGYHRAFCGGTHGS